MIRTWWVHFGPLEESGKGGITRGGVSSCSGTQRDRGKNTCQVWRGRAVRCIVGHVEVQRCCHGDTLRQSVLALGVRGCKSAYATSALILTAGAAGKRLTRSESHLSEAARRGACRGGRFFSRSGERLGVLKHGGSREEGFNFALAVSVVCRREGLSKGGMDG